jgi:hypothetical protein
MPWTPEYRQKYFVDSGRYGWTRERSQAYDREAWKRRRIKEGWSAQKVVEARVVVALNQGLSRLESLLSEETKKAREALYAD